MENHLKITSPSFTAQNLRKSSLRHEFGGGSRGVAVDRTTAGGGQSGPKSLVRRISKWLYPSQVDHGWGRIRKC